MTRTLLENALLLDPEAPSPEPGRLLLEGGRIEARAGAEEGQLGPLGDVERIDLGGQRIAPGFIDLHFHGGLVFRDPAEYALDLRRAAASLVRHGTTAFLPTTVAWAADSLMTRVIELARVIGDAANDAATPLGIHLEGPWINREAAGAQPRSGIRPFDAVEAESLLAAAEGTIRMVTLAPEVEGAAALQALLARRGVLTSLGHSLADTACVAGAIERGARHVTHLFNAMGSFHHRVPGLVGVALSDDRLSCDLICDGVHVHPAAVRMAARSKGDGLVLISDNMEPGADGFGSGAVHDDGVVLRLSDGTLAGSTLTLDRALRNSREWGVLDPIPAVAACTLRPARLLGLESERGTLRSGARADLAVLDAAGQVTQTWIAGRRVY